MAMQKWLGGLAAVAVTLLVAMGLATGSRPPEASSLSGKVASTTEGGFRVMAWEGRLAVFEAGQTHPLMVYEDVAVAALPPEEQERLLFGIFLPDRAALNRLLEDYTG